MTYTLHPPFAHTSGPRTAQVALVGEAFGEQEELTGLPFVGQSGQELTRMLAEASLSRRDCFLTNVFAFRPPSNNIELLCVNKAIAGKDYTRAHIKPGKYIAAQWLPEVERLYAELEAVRPNIIVALGNTACWALLGKATISALRGTVVATPYGKVLPTYHPAAVLRQWAWRPIVIADLLKVAREKDYAEVRRPERHIIVDPSLCDIENWLKTNERASRIAVDIETKLRQIEMIGFAANRSEALVIPFVDKRFASSEVYTAQQATLEHSSPHWVLDPQRRRNSYWPTQEEEVRAWNLVERILTLPGEKVYQNGLFDLQYICRMGLRVSNAMHDTMLLHHSMYPEMQKSLGFLGSIYAQDGTPSWKLMRNKHEELKRDE